MTQTGLADMGKLLCTLRDPFLVVKLGLHLNPNHVVTAIFGAPDPHQSDAISLGAVTEVHLSGITNSCPGPAPPWQPKQTEPGPQHSLNA